MTANCKVSVLLPVHNAVRYLPEALASLAGQSFRDFEVVAVDDGSTDGSGPLLDQQAQVHRWLRVIHQEKGGIARALNRAFVASTGALIARMDADDISEPDRFATQVAFLDAHPAVGVCGSWARQFGEGSTGSIQAPETDDAIRAWLVFGSAFVHPAVMLRREVLAKVAGPFESGTPPIEYEDYTLWLRLARHTQFHNIPRELLRYRCHPDQATGQPAKRNQAKLIALRLGLLAELGLDCSDAEKQIHLALGFEPVTGARPADQAVADWLEKLSRAVPAAGWCSAAALRADCAEAWWRFHCAGPHGLAGAWRYGRSRLAEKSLGTLRRMARLALR